MKAEFNPIKQILERHATATVAVEAEGAEIATLLCEFVGWVERRPECDIVHNAKYWLPYEVTLHDAHHLTTAIAEKIGAEWVNAALMHLIQYPHYKPEDLLHITACAARHGANSWTLPDKDFIAALALAVAAKLEEQK